ncbi:hypothetical protein VNN41_09985 [Lactococcus garvieae]|uniref:hypothetical protein n=1 Tax=Lactococcus garvieae TaxID=1363 RepID=UPI003251533D
MANENKSNFGVPRDLFATFKFYFLSGPDLAVLGIGIFSGFSLMSVFPVSQWLNMILCIVLIGVLSLFLVLRSNGGKRNYEIILFYLKSKTSQKKKAVKMLNLGEETYGK